MTDAQRFLRLACLTYDGVGPGEWAQGRALLADRPGLVHGSVHAAAAAADVPALRRNLAADPAAAGRDGGPHHWAPILYLAYARHDPTIDREAVLGAARMLLDAGADPNAGFTRHDLPSPFTVLTGAFGQGERGPRLQPRHPHSLALARVLLAAGADPNDAQALYNRMFEPDDDHLALLLAFGLGTGDGGPWRARLGGDLESPAAMVRRQLGWAIIHGLTARVRLLADHGVDLVTPSPDGTTPAELAAANGRRDLVDALVARGAIRPTLGPPDALVAAVLAADRRDVDQLRRAHPGLVEQVRSARPGLMAWAAACGGRPAVEILVDLGFDINARGRTDVPGDQPWQTALHKAVEDADLDLARTLLALGADPDVTDMRFGATALGWAQHLGHRRLVDLLEPLTTPRPPPSQQP